MLCSRAVRRALGTRHPRDGPVRDAADVVSQRAIVLFRFDEGNVSPIVRFGKTCVSRSVVTRGSTTGRAL